MIIYSTSFLTTFVQDGIGSIFIKLVKNDRVQCGPLLLSAAEERLILLDLSVADAIATHECGYQKEFYQEVPIPNEW
jgi:hypothetical protein